MTASSHRLGRRTLLRSGLGAGAACLCGGSALAQWPNGATSGLRVDAVVPVGGCNLDQRAAAAFLRQYRISTDISDLGAEYTEGEFALLDYFTTCQVASEQWFGVEPRFGFVEDMQGANAFATPVRMFGGAEPDGTVVFGKRLLASYIGTGAAMRTALAVIVAHEYAHILQFKRQRAGRCPHVELEADFLSGWMLGNESHYTRAGRGIGSDPAVAARVLFDKGDTNFTSPSHHGTPDQRMRQVIAGYTLGLRRAPLEAAWATALVSTSTP